MIELKIEDRVARLFLARPEKANALSSPMLAQLAESIEKLRGDETLRALVLAGRGNAFCGGADTAELSRLDASNAGAFVDAIHRVCHAIRALPVPVVAQLHGAAIGGGLEIAAACDLRVAAEGTKFVMPEVRLGIPSVVEAALLPRLMGAGRAAWLVLTGEAIDARRAYEWGLVEEVAADVQQSTERLVKSLLAGDRAALAAQKRLMHLWDEAPLSESVTTSIAEFNRSYTAGVPQAMRRLKR